MKHTSFYFMSVLVLSLAACAPAASQPAEAIDAPAPVPATDAAAVPTEMIATELATYTDPAYGFSFDYPAAWMLDVVKLGDRAPQSVQLTSWAHEPGLISEAAEGGTIVNIVVQLWDPKGDLNAFAEQRRLAWDSSGIAILLQEEVTLTDGRAAHEFVVQSSDEESYFLLTVLGEQYLVVSGSGDIEAIRQVARSVR